MALVIPREQEELVIAAARLKMIGLKQKKAEQRTISLPDWMEQHFYVLPFDDEGEPNLADEPQPIKLFPFQRAVLLYMLTRRNAQFEPDPNGRFPFKLMTYSAVKKSGKSTMGGAVGRWMAETQTRFGEVPFCANDMKQALERAFFFAKQSIMLTPGYVDRGPEGVLPDRWIIQATRLTCLTTGTRIQAISVDARGEAGGAADASIWTEAWGLEKQEAERFYHEMTPPPTKIDAFRFVETYAGFDGESPLLRSIYELGKAGRQLTAGELAEATGTPLGVFEEAPNPDDLVPLYVNEPASLCMYWDEGLEARRLPWQRGERGRAYYAKEEQNLPPSFYTKLHLNQWAGSESDFVPMAQWDACYDPELTMLEPGDRTPCVLGVDAAVSGDCFGIVLVTRNPKNKQDVAVRAVKAWTPPKGGVIDHEGPEAFMRVLCKGGCAMGHPQVPPFKQPAPELCPHTPDQGRACIECCPACRDKVLIPPYNIMQIAYDPYQLESMMQKFRKDGITWVKAFNQTGDRLKADSMLYDLIINRRIAHMGNEQLRQHVQNAKAKMSANEDTKLRIVKKGEQRKVDLLVATSMAAYRCLYLRL
jgi:hypothetical protein